MGNMETIIWQIVGFLIKIYGSMGDVNMHNLRGLLDFTFGMDF